jgi:hypothetical protein
VGCQGKKTAAKYELKTFKENFHIFPRTTQRQKRSVQRVRLRCQKLQIVQQSTIWCHNYRMF